MSVSIALIRHGAERMVNVKPNKDQFVEYVSIRDSGETNMYDIKYIEGISLTGLNKEICFYIMKHFTELADEYGVKI